MLRLRKWLGKPWPAMMAAFLVGAMFLLQGATEWNRRQLGSENVYGLLVPAGFKVLIGGVIIAVTPLLPMIGRRAERRAKNRKGRRGRG